MPGSSSAVATDAQDTIRMQIRQHRHGEGDDRRAQDERQMANLRS